MIKIIEIEDLVYREPEYNPIIIGYLKAGKPDKLNYYKNNNYSTSYQYIAKELKPFDNCPMYNNYALFMVKYSNGTYLWFYDNTVEHYVPIAVWNDKPTKALLHLAYPELSDNDINSLHVNLHRMYTFYNRSEVLKGAGSFYLKQE